MAGLVPPFLEKANRVTSVAVITHGESLAHMRFTPEESPYPFIAMVPQDVTERLLLEALRNRGGDVEYRDCISVREPNKRIKSRLSSTMVASQEEISASLCDRL